jgi:Fumarase C-terminus
MLEHGCVYFGAVEGHAALLAQCITRAEVIAHEDLGLEAIRRLEVVDFPAVVVNDLHGHDLYEEGPYEEGPRNGAARSDNIRPARRAGSAADCCARGPQRAPKLGGCLARKAGTPSTFSRPLVPIPRPALIQLLVQQRFYEAANLGSIRKSGVPAAEQGDRLTG